MAETKLARPRQVTMAAGIGLVASVLLVVSLFDTLTQLRSVEMRTDIERFLSQPPGDGLGLDVAGIVDLLRGLVFLNGALAAVTAVLAVYLFQRHQGARIGFTIAAAVLALTSPITGGALAIMVGFSGALLWSRPARDWFAGREPAPAPTTTTDPFARTVERPDSRDWAPPTPPAQAPHDETGSGAPADRPAPAAYPFGERPTSAWAPPAAQAAPNAAPSPYAPPAPLPAPVRRPVTVLIAVLTTWFFAGLVLFVLGGILLLLLVDQQGVLDLLRDNPDLPRSGMSTQDLLSILWVACAVGIVWSLAAMVLAFFTLRRHGWARIMLVVSSVMAALVGLLGLLPGWVLSAAAVATVVMLFSGGANQWFSGRGDRPQGPPAPAPPTQPQSQQPVDPHPQKPRKPGKRQVW